MRRYNGAVYLAANWIAVGATKGYARSNGKYTNKHGVKKKMLVYPLQADARELLRVGGHIISAGGDHIILAGERAELSDCL